MSKITKQQLQQHEAAEELLWSSDRPLRRDEVEFCLEHWEPWAVSGNHVGGSKSSILYVDESGPRFWTVGWWEQPLLVMFV